MTNLQKIELSRRKIFTYVVGDIFRTLRGGALMGTFVQSFCLLDYLSAIGNFAGNEKNNENYKEFIGKYLSSYSPDKLYAIRCGLIHTYGQSKRMLEAKLSGYSFQHKNPENHLKYENNVYWLNLSNFLFDIIKSAFIFFKDLEKINENDLFDFAERAKNIISVRDESGIRVNANYGSIDNILSPMDMNNINWTIVENDIYKLCLSY